MTKTIIVKCVRMKKWTYIWNQKKGIANNELILSFSIIVNNYWWIGQMIDDVGVYSIEGDKKINDNAQVPDKQKRVIKYIHNASFPMVYNFGEQCCCNYPDEPRHRHIDHHCLE